MRKPNTLCDSDCFISSAAFSKCGLFRWSLKRKLNDSLKCLIFIGLNPSNADEINDDNTTRRLINSCNRWGYGRLIVINLFARISCSPSVLLHCSDPIGEENNKELTSKLNLWSEDANFDLWLGWGNKGVIYNRNIEVLSALKKFSEVRVENCPQSLGPMAIGITRKEQPIHPLYIASSRPLKQFHV